MFNEANFNPATIVAEAEIRAEKRKRIVKIAIDVTKARIANKDKPIDGRAKLELPPTQASPTVNTIAGGRQNIGTQHPKADCTPIHDEANAVLTPYTAEPHRVTTQAELAIIEEVDRINRRRNQYIKDRIRLINGGKAQLRLAVGAAKFTGEKTKEELEEMRKAADKAWSAACDPDHTNHELIAATLAAIAPLDAAQEACEKTMVKLVKQLPVYEWVKAVNGFGDVSFATVVGECGDIGSYRNPSCIWKRMGLAPYDGKAMATWRKVGGLSAEQWTECGYSPKRRSVSYNLNKIIGAMGLWRPVFGSDLSDANYYQRVFAERARLEAEKLGAPVTESAKGKESYTKYVENRAQRYTQKRLLRELWRAWRA